MGTRALVLGGGGLVGAVLHDQFRWQSGLSTPPRLARPRVVSGSESGKPVKEQLP